MPEFLLMLLAVLILLFLICIARAVRVKAKPSDKKSVLSVTDDESSRYAQCLSEMIKVPTISLRGKDDLTEFYKLHDVMKTLFPLIHEKLERVELSGNLLYRWKGKDASRDGLLLMGHQDVVTAEEKGWTRDPFSGEITDGKIHGRGAMDCKCTVMAEFCAVEELLREGFEPPRDIYLSCSVNEEISGDGAPSVVRHLQEKGISLCAVMDEGGAIIGGVLPGMKSPWAAVGVVEKGYIDVKIIAKGHGGHSSTPPKNTPVARLAAFVAEVEKKRPFKKQMPAVVVTMLTSAAPYMSFPFRLVLSNLWLFKPLLTAVLPAVSAQAGAFVSTTFAFTMCGGSKTPNVIPDEAYVVCNLRPSVGQNDEESLAVLKKYADKYDLSMEIQEKRGASRTTDPDGAEFLYVKKCLNDCFPAVAPFYMCGGTDCRHYEAVSSNCLRFCPVTLDAQQLAAMHAANENVGIDALAKSVKFYKYYLQNHA